MAQARDNHFNPTSPRSSAGVPDSFKGTPDTRWTAFSPEGGSAKSSSLLQGFSRSSSATPPVRMTGNSYRGSASQIDRDPFVSPIHSTRLSPTASAFSPHAQSPNFPIHQQHGRSIMGNLSTELGISHHLDISSSTPLCVSEVETCLNDLAEKGVKIYGSHELRAQDGHVFIHFFDLRDASWALPAIRLAQKSWSVFYTNGETAEEVSESPNQGLLQLGQVLVMATMPSGTAFNASQLSETVRNSLEAYGDLFAFVPQINYPDGSFRAIAQYCKRSDAIDAVKKCNGHTAEGIHLSVTPPSIRTPATCDIAEALQDISLAKSPGNLHHQTNGRGQAIPSLNSQPQFPIYPFMIQSPMGASMPYVLERVSLAGQINSISPMTPSYPLMRPVYQTPPSPALTVRNDFSPSRPSSSFPRFDSRRQNAARITRSPYHNSTTHHNHVDIGRIRDGIDVRTTIMLRNIPNKVDQAMLKRIIDESSWGKYDFMYLRIDFANDCNVGYAFINFVDPLDIIDFVNARGNQRWYMTLSHHLIVGREIDTTCRNCFKSDKVAEISYATIQGKDCLVQKFRNSSVMLEAPHYRPKLFFTSNGPMPELAGQEEAFPEPDNQSKMKRSCENAEHVASLKFEGLFTPNAGQHFRDEQRRRRSQYDRGTRLAALEEYDYDTAIQHYYGSGTQ
ncbi:RNA recognition motif 2-domain-containing protein [Mariannaea sp. PMI_226]|nr:RNA recognition motif 2-domain-containing protein [Mariannaea sp. PMI_226]